MVKGIKKGATSGGPSPEYSVTITLNSLVSKAVRNKFLLFISHPVYGTLWQQLKDTRRHTVTMIPTLPITCGCTFHNSKYPTRSVCTNLILVKHCALSRAFLHPLLHLILTTAREVENIVIPISEMRKLMLREVK